MSILSICLSVHLFLYSITIHDCIDYLDGSKTLTKFYTRQQHCGQNCLIIAFIKWFIDLYKRFWSSIKQNIYYVRYLLLMKICWILKIHWRLVFSFRSINLKNLTIAIDSDFNKFNKVIYYTQSICPSIPHIWIGSMQIFCPWPWPEAIDQIKVTIKWNLPLGVLLGHFLN